MSSEGASARSGAGTWLPGVGHLPFLEATADFEAALSAFVTAAAR